MKIVKKTLLLTSILLFIIGILSCNIYKSEALTLSDMESQTRDFISTGESESSGISTDGIFDDLVDLGSILTTVGAGIMVIATLYMGIKYVTATPDAQARLKQQLIGLVVSGVVIFGAYFIWKIVVGIVSKF
jgi:hypothetical protein